MEALMSSWIIPWQQPPHRKPLKARIRVLCCSAVNGSSSPSSEIKLQGCENAEAVSQPQESPSSAEEPKQGEIWRLFREAQKNIIHLNQYRLKAVEDLNRINREKQLLVDKIEQLELEKQATVGKPQDRLSVCWELLLRIDSMVLTGMVSTVEASDLRRLVMDQRVIVAEIFNGTLQKSDAEILMELRHFSERSLRNGFHIVHICAEMAPLVSVGSLASYVTGLSCALQRKGHLVEVIIPKYSSLNLDEVQGLQEIEAESYSYFNGQLHGNRIWTGVVYGIGVTMIQPLDYSSFFNRERVYGYSDDFERFTYFSRASLDYIVKSGKHPDVIHVHNWETAIVGPLFWDIIVKLGLEGTRILLTCHDLNSQYLEHPEKLALCGLDPLRLHRPDRLQDDTKSHLVNVLKGGVVYSNKVIIMSSILLKGRTIRNLSHGLDPTINIHKNKVISSPYGFDNSTWDSSKDKFLPQQFSVSDMKGKAVCKAALQQHVGFPEHASTILVGCIFSEVSDVVLENLKAIFSNAKRINVQFIIMGLSNMSTVKLGSLHEQLKDENVRFLNGHDDALSHLIFAGSDIMLCESFHDPVDQVQLKALKYGAAPFAVNSGDVGLRNFLEHDYQTTLSRFISSTFGNLSISQALDEIKNDPTKWKRKMKDAMEMDFSWDAECCDIHASAYADIKKL